MPVHESAHSSRRSTGRSPVGRSGRDKVGNYCTYNAAAQEVLSLRSRSGTEFPRRWLYPLAAVDVDLQTRRNIARPNSSSREQQQARPHPWACPAGCSGCRARRSCLRPRRQDAGVDLARRHRVHPDAGATADRPPARGSAPRVPPSTRHTPPRRTDAPANPRSRSMFDHRPARRLQRRSAVPAPAPRTRTKFTLKMCSQSACAISSAPDLPAVRAASARSPRC